MQATERGSDNNDRGVKDAEKDTTMISDFNRLSLFAGAAILRILFFVLFPALPALLGSRVEVSTPITSFKRLQEGLFLYTHDLTPYDGGIYHQAPLLLPVFSLLPDYRVQPIWTNLVFVVTDLLTALALVHIAESEESTKTRLFTSSRKNMRWSADAVASAYLYNPFTIASCLAQSTGVFTNCAVVHAVAAAISGNVVNAVFALATASYLSMYPIFLTPPLALLSYDRISVMSKSTPAAAQFYASFVIGLVLGVGGLFYASYAIMDSSWDFLSATYGVQLTLTDLTPNIGLWWYFFIEMFDSFREFFLAVFWLHMASYVSGLTIRIREQPLFVITSLLGIFTIFKPYPSISDASLYFAMLPLYRHIFPLLRYGFIEMAAMLYATFLGPAFYHLWIYAGSGNANFFYAITLVWSLGLTLVVTDSIYATLCDQFEVERPEVKGKDIRQI